MYRLNRKSNDAESESESDNEDAEHYYDKNRIALLRDERVCFQKKIFTKFINSYMKSEYDQIRDLFVDLRNGIMLLKFLQAISGETIKIPTNGKTKLQAFENINTALDFLRMQKVYLENISCGDIYEGKQNLTLGLIWEIILKFCINLNVNGSLRDTKEILLNWCQTKTAAYKNVDIKNFSYSWCNGLAFNALIHKYRPDLIDYDYLKKENATFNLLNAFDVAQKEFGIVSFLDAEMVNVASPDDKSIMTYVATYFQYFSKTFPEPEFYFAANKIEQDEQNVAEGRFKAYIAYLGSCEVDEKRGLDVCEKAFAYLKSQENVTQAVLSISVDEVTITEEKSAAKTTFKIDKISYCVCDQQYGNGFGFIWRNTEQRKWIYYGFLTEMGKRTSDALGCAFKHAELKKKHEALRAENAEFMAHRNSEQKPVPDKMNYSDADTFLEELKPSSVALQQQLLAPEEKEYVSTEWIKNPIKLVHTDNNQKRKNVTVGIDLGTTECCVAVLRKNGPELVVLDPITRLRTMPSYVAFDEKEPMFGQIVVDRMRYNAQYSVFDSKRIIGRNFEAITIDPLWSFGVTKNENDVLLEVETFAGKGSKTPEEVLAAILNYIKTTTETFQGENLSNAVITIPAKFTEQQKQATKLAAEYAGWKTIYFLTEPHAAAFAYLSELEIPHESNVLIFDCGGGTVDICVCKVRNKQLEILSCDGDSYLGGRDFDNVLFTHFNAILQHKYDIDVTKSHKKYILKQKCQDIKHKLSVAAKDWVDVEDFNCNINEIIEITKFEFEDMTTGLVLRLKNAILRSLLKSKLQRNEIGYVLQVGGGCRMPMLKHLLHQTFPNSRHECSHYPDWVVAHGAALYASYLNSEEIPLN